MITNNICKYCGANIITDTPNLKEISKSYAASYKKLMDRAEQVDIKCPKCSMHLFKLKDTVAGIVIECTFCKHPFGSVS